MHDICSSLIVSICMYVPSYSRGESIREKPVIHQMFYFPDRLTYVARCFSCARSFIHGEYMMCINIYSLVKRVCVGHASYILSA